MSIIKTVRYKSIIKFNHGNEVLLTLNFGTLTSVKFKPKEVFGNLENQVNMIQSKTSYINRYKNKLVFY